MNSFILSSRQGKAFSRKSKIFAVNKLRVFKLGFRNFLVNLRNDFLRYALFRSPYETQLLFPFVVRGSVLTLDMTAT